MATTNLEAWKKHFSGKGDVKTFISKEGAHLIPDTSPFNKNAGRVARVGEEIIVLALESEDDYRSYCENPSAANPLAYIPVLLVSDKRRYLVDFSKIAKPIENKVDLKLQTTNLVKGATIEEYDVIGFTGVKCVSFDNSTALRQRILTNLKTHQPLNQALAFKKDMIEYFEGKDCKKIQWSGVISDNEKAQFAKYVGELIIGLYVFEGNDGSINGVNPFAGKNIAKFVVPVDQSFPGIDSFFITDKGEIIPISSKSGTGAKPSVFMNIFPVVLKHREIMDKNSYLKDVVVPAMDKLGITAQNLLNKRGSKEVIYEIGVRDILGVSETQLKDSYEVFRQFKKFSKVTDYSLEVRTIYSKLVEKMILVENQSALKNLDSSTTMFFCSEIANRLNEKESLEQMVRVLSGKNYYQANLNQNELFKNGKISFKMLRSGEARLKILGEKSGYNDIDATKGTLSFELKYVGV